MNNCLIVNANLVNEGVITQRDVLIRNAVSYTHLDVYKRQH